MNAIKGRDNIRKNHILSLNNIVLYQLNGEKIEHYKPANISHHHVTNDLAETKFCQRLQ